MGRRRNAVSSDESDDGDGAVGSRPQVGAKAAGAGKKKYVPGMSGRDQKARAKEQRLEQERRKAERDRRNEDKRERRERQHAEEEEALAVETPPPRSGGKHQQRKASEAISTTPGGSGLHDVGQIRRDLRRLFGRIEHGGGVSPITGRTVTLDDVVVVLVDAAVEERRKSGAGAWSQRLSKGEREVPMSAFNISSQDGEATSPATGAFTRGHGGGEPPYHLVRRVLARWSGDDEEILWTNHHGSVNATDAAAAVAGAMSGLRIAGSGSIGESRRGAGGASGSYGSYGSPRGGMQKYFDGKETSSGSMAPAVEALTLLPRHCWEHVMSACDPRGVCCLGATCAALAAIARSSQVRQAQHVALFGRPAPAVSEVPVERLRNINAPPTPKTPDALAEICARRGWAAVCTSVIAAEQWIPRAMRSRADEDDDDGEDSEYENEDEDEDAMFMFPDDVEDAALAPAASTPSSSAAVVPSALETLSDNTRDSSAPCPVPKYTGVGPHSATHMLANGATAVSCDGDKIKLWFHGGDGQAEAGKRIATLNNPAGTTPWSLSAFTSGPGVFVAGDTAGRVTVWDSDSLEVRHARLVGTQLVDHEVRALTVVPTSGLVAVGSTGVRLLDVSVDGGGIVVADMDIGSEEIASLVVTGVSTAGGRFARGYGAGGGGGAPRLWAATTNGTLTAVDLEALQVVERMQLPDLPPARLAAHGNMIVAGCERVAMLYDLRASSSSINAPVAVCGHTYEDDVEGSIGAGEVGSTTTVALDDWAVWLAHRGCDGVRLYDTRRAAGPPRRNERWHPADAAALSLPAVAIYGAGGGGRRVAVGCFARGDDGVLVVAPDTGENARCSVYTGAHWGAGGGVEVEFDEFKGARTKNKKMAVKKIRKKYPKRQGGKFRARTAGG